MNENDSILRNYDIYYEVTLGATTYVFYDMSIAEKFISYAILGCTDITDLRYIVLQVKSKYTGGSNDRTAD